MNFEDFIKVEKVIIGEKDIQKAKAIIKTSKNTMISAESLEVNDTTASSVLTLSYEALREIIEAICLTEGYKVYSHEAFSFYLKKINETRLAEDFDRLRRLRNGANYYGKQISIETAKEAKINCKKICEILKNKYLGEIK